MHAGRAGLGTPSGTVGAGYPHPRGAIKHSILPIGSIGKHRAQVQLHVTESMAHEWTRVATDNLVVTQELREKIVERVHQLPD